MKPTKTPKPQKPEAVEPDEGAVVAAEIESPEAGPVQAAVHPDADDMVRITMLEEVSPAPVVGSFRFDIELGVTKLESRKTYRVPRSVGARMQDTGTAVMLEA